MASVAPPATPSLPAIGAGMFAALTLVVIGDTAGKALTGAGVAPFFVGWSRFLLALVLLAPMLGPLRANLRQSFSLPLALRGAAIAGGISSILTALRTEPIANVYGAFFIGPVVAYVLARLVLAERTSLPRSLLMATGFLGVMMVVQPGLAFRPGMAFALLAGCLYGVYLVMTRQLAPRMASRTLLFSQLFWGAVLLTPMGAPGAAGLVGMLTPGLAALVLVSALGSAAGNYLIVRISRLAPASLVAPLVYLQLISATLAGWIVFGALPGPLALAGLAVITASGLASLWLARGALRV